MKLRVLKDVEIYHPTKVILKAGSIIEVKGTNIGAVVLVRPDNLIITSEKEQRKYLEEVVEVEHL